MRVLGVDPGYDRAGLAVLEYQAGKETILYSTCTETDKQVSTAERIFTIGQLVGTVIKDYQVDTLAIETLFFNKNTKTALQVAEARGVIINTALQHNCQLFEFSPQAIKIANTGYGASDKTAMIAMIQKLIPTAPQNALDDEYDAIAVGVTCLATHGRTR